MADGDQILLKLVEKIANEQKYVKYNVKLEPVSSGGANYTSKLYHVTVTETDRSDLNLFAKIAALSEKDRPPAVSKIYDTERIAYTKLINIYRTLEERYKIPDEHKLSFPKYYDCNPTKYEEAIVMENLTATGFSLFSRLKSVDWKFAAKAVDELAKLHALSFAYEALYPEDFKDFLAVVKRELVDNDQMREHWKHVTSSAVNATKAENRDILKRFLDKGKFEVLVKHLAPLRRTAITHGDYRVSNLMYRTCDVEVRPKLTAGARAVSVTLQPMADAQHFKTLLAKIAEEQKFDNYDIKTEEISTGGANYTSKLYTIRIKEKENELYLFAKVAAVGEKMRSQAPKFYDTERFAYTKLAKIYYQLQEDSKVPDEDRLIFPKYYGCNPDKFKETIVLEDLVAAGYSAYDRFKSVDWPYASSAVTELAKMHALSFAYAKRYPEEFEETADEFKFEWDMNNEAMGGYMKGIFEKAVNITRKENQEKLGAYLSRMDADFFTMYYKATRAPVLCHGDYRPSNLMHRKRDNGEIEIRIVDLQTLQGGSPVVDLLYFIFTGSDEQFRAAHYERLVAHYYEQLARALRRLALDPATTYSRDDFHYELQEKLPFGLCIAVFALPVVTVAAEDAPSVDEELDIASFSVERTSDLYAERLNGVVNDYVKWGVLT